MEAALCDYMLLTCKNLLERWCNLYWIWASRVISLLPGGDYITGLWIPQGTSRA